MFIIKSFRKSLFFGLLALSICYGSVDTRSTYDLKIPEKRQEDAMIQQSVDVKNETSLPGRNTAVTRPETSDVKAGPIPSEKDGKASVVSKEVSKLQEIDFSKLWIDASKKLSNKMLPLMTIEAENLSKLCQKVTQIADKVFPDCASLVSLAITGFMGGLDCPGVDEKAPCYVVIFLSEGKIDPVFLFKSQTDCLLVKNLTANKSPDDTLKTIPNGSNKICWQMYGNATLLKALDKDLRQVFPFIYQEKNSGMCLKFCLDFNIWNDIFQKVEDKSVPWTFIKYCWDTFVIPDIKKVEMGFDVTDKILETKMAITPREYSALAFFIKSMVAKSKERKFLIWSSREMIQEQDFENYSGLKNCVESLDRRIKYSRYESTFVEQFKNWWGIISPLLKEILAFCDENLTGNTQSYSDLQNSGDLISSKGFGFFEKKSHLTRDVLLQFIEGIIAKGKTSLKEAIDKKYFGSEFCKDISLNVKKSVEKHCNHDIDQVFWKGNGTEAYYPIWFAIHKNYLLYADDISNLKRLIERMDEMKTPSYMALEGNTFSHAKIDLGSIIRLLGSELIKPLPALSVEITSGIKEGDGWCNVKTFGFWDAFSLKTLLPTSSESGNKEGGVHPVNPMNAPTTK